MPKPRIRQFWSTCEFVKKLSCVNIMLMLLPI
jgi:hypothetical protein